MPRRVLVTGAGGYIGRHVVSALARRDVEVVATRLPGGAAADVPEPVRWVDVDLMDPATHAEILEGVDVVVHLAWRDGFVLNSPAHMEDLSGHYRFLRAAAQAGVGTVAALGTMHEVGYWEGAIDESTPCRPQNQYGVAKVALRESLALELAASGTTFQWLRCYYITGDDSRSRSVFSKILAAVEAGQPTFPFTTGKNLYDFIDVSELGELIASTVLQSEVTGVIECCSGTPRSLADRVEQFIADSGLPITLDYGAFPDRPFDSPGTWGDAGKVHRVLTGTGTQERTPSA